MITRPMFRHQSTSYLPRCVNINHFSKFKEKTFDMKFKFKYQNKYFDSENKLKAVEIESLHKIELSYAPN